MAEPTPDGQEPQDAEILPFKVPRDTSFEHALDETVPKPEPVHAGDGAELPRLGGERRPIVPRHLRSPHGIWKVILKYLDAAGFHAAFHALRSPKYLALGVVWAVVGLGKIARDQQRWWWVTEHAPLRSKAIVEGNAGEWRKLHSDVVRRRSFRGFVLLGALVAVAVTLVLIAAFCPWWAWLIVAAVAMPPLAHHGHPRHLPIVQSAVTTPLVPKISTDAIIRAYERAGLCSTDPKKPADHLGFGSTMTRDTLDKGSQVVIYLPYGGTFAKVVNNTTEIASGLDVAVSQVYFTRDKQSERRHTLRVLDADPLSEPAGARRCWTASSALSGARSRSGIDQFGRKVAFCLLWISLLIGAQPRRGKTFAARLIALFAALDPYVDITLIDGKSSKDWQPLRLVAHRFVQGTHPTKEGDPVGRALEALYEIDRHIVHVNEELAKLPVSECPEGKLTEKLYRRPDLHVQLVLLEEFQCYFELDDQKRNKEFANLFARIGALGPSAGVILVGASQKPSGVGAGDV